MALNDFKPQFDNTYQEIFQKVLVAKKIANMRFEPVLSYGASVARVAYDISGVIVRTVVRGSASTIDSLTDTAETLTINVEKEAVFHISDGEATQAGPLNPGEVIGGQVAIKVAGDLDARIFAEVANAAYTFDTGDLTTLSSNGTPFAIDSTTTPQFVSRAPAKLRANNQTLSNLVLVVDSYAASDLAQYLMGKSIDLAGSVFANGYGGTISMAEVYVSENLTGQATLTMAGNLVDTQTIVINGITFTSVTSIGSTAGNFLISTTDPVNLVALINNPGTTSSTQVALSAADQAKVTDLYRLSATRVSATVMTVTGTGSGALVLSETQTNASWGKNHIKAYFGKRGAIDVVVQDLKSVDMRPTADRRGTNVFCSYLAGIKTFTDGSKKFLNVLLAK